MKIKSYRAASLREALIQIKAELGEDALVLETKQVRAGGLFGVGARNLVEVRVAPNPQKKAAARRARPAAPAQTKLNLTDDSAATPARADSTADEAEQGLKAFAALAARAYAGNSGLRTKEEKPNRAPRSAPAPQRQIVELAETAPRVVHRRPAPPPAPPRSEASPKASPEAARPQKPSAPAERPSFEADLTRLLAELREMKYALGSFAARPAARAAQDADGGEADATFYDSPHYETFLELRNTGLPAGLARQAVRQATGLGEAHDPRSRARLALTSALPGWVQFAGAAQTLPERAAFIGSTGVGKTTTIAKLAAHLALRIGRRVELVTLDTYRIAAVQQLKTYAEIIGAGCHVARTVAELNTLLHRFAGQATVLIDTTGRNPHDLADQIEIADYLREQRALLKCLVLPATNHPDEARLALNKFALYGVNRLVLTKLDETVQPGAAVSMAVTAALPLLYLCAGQRVPEDLECANPATFAQRVLRAQSLASAA